jgi:hypothetical protein
MACAGGVSPSVPVTKKVDFQKSVGFDRIVILAVERSTGERRDQYQVLVPQTAALLGNESISSSVHQHSPH